MTLSGPEDRVGKHQELHRNLSWHRDNITKLQEVALLSQDRAVHEREFESNKEGNIEKGVEEGKVSLLSSATTQ